MYGNGGVVVYRRGKENAASAQEAEARVSAADGEGGGYRQAAGDYRVQGVKGCCRG